MSQKRRQLSKNSGSIVAMLLIIMVVLMALGTGLLSMGYNSRLLAIRACSHIKARCAADAGLAAALAAVKEQVAAGTLSDDALPQVESIALEHCDATYSYSVSKNADDDYVVEGTGVSGPVHKQVRATLSSSAGPFDYGLIAKAVMQKGANSVWDAYNLPPGEKAQFGTTATSVAEGEVRLGDTLVDGDVVVGVEADPATMVMNNSTVTGDIYALEEEFDWPDVTVPTWLGNLPSQGYLENFGVLTLTTSGKYDKITVGRSDLLIIDGPVTLYVTPSSLEVEQTGEIQINKDNPDASLTIYLGECMGMSTGGIINNLTGDPTRVRIFGTPGCVNFTCRVGGQLYALFYLPNAAVNFNNAMELYGAMACRNFISDRNVNFHYDGSVRGESVPELPGSGVSIKRWSE